MIIRLAQESLKQANLKEIPDVESYSAVGVRCGRRCRRVHSGNRRAGR